MNTCKNLICLVVIMIVGVSCATKEAKQEQISEKNKDSMIQIDVIGNSQFIRFTPIDCEMEYVVENPPSVTDSTILLCVAASFTGQRLVEFKHSNICGTYIVDSVVYNRHAASTTNIDASFAYWSGKVYFAKGKSLELLDSALQNKGVFFMQKQVLCDGERGEMNLTRSTIYRVLAKYNDKLCVIQNTQPMEYMPFVQGLENLGIKDAIYLDMGGWRYSWYRDEEGKVIELFPVTNDTKYQTNWIIFRTKKK